jgi:peptidoglycan/LPS O-acetylase OafA/YrhL
VLDGLRGLAALAVVHVHLVFYSGLSALDGGGHAGVVVFFVLSGYLVTRRLWRRTADAPLWATYATFVRRRAVRLYPALVGMVVISGAVFAVLDAPALPGVLRVAPVVLVQATAPFVATGPIAVEPWQHTWSLTVEWVFYLAWPVLLLAARRRVDESRLRALVLVTAAVLYLASLALSPRTFYFLAPANWSAMLFGAGLALHHAVPGRREDAGREPLVVALGVALLVVATLLPSSLNGHVVYRYSVFPAAVVVAFVVIDHRRDRAGVAIRLLGSRALSGVGVSSYSLYLWHLPVVWAVRVAWPDAPPLLVCATALLVLVPVVAASYVLLERPWLVGSGTRYPLVMRSTNRAWWLPS